MTMLGASPELEKATAECPVRIQRRKSRRDAGATKALEHSQEWLCHDGGAVLWVWGTVLISGGDEETDWCAALGARIEFRGAGGERGGGEDSGRGNCDCGEQSRRR